MKKVYLTLVAVILITHFSYAQWVTTTPGTTSTTDNIIVSGTNSRTSNAIFPLTSITPTISQAGSAGYRALFLSPFESSKGSGKKYLIDAGINTAAGGAGTHTSMFNIDDVGNAYFAGNVGIGDLSPTTKLQILDTALNLYSPTDKPNFNTLVHHVNTSSNNNQYTSLGFYTTVRMDADRNSFGAITLINTNGQLHASDFAFTLRTGNGDYIERLRISSIGNVGIGTTTPSNALSFGNAANRKIGIEASAADVIGRSLVIGAGETVAGSAVNDVAGGGLILQAGRGTGTGSSTISFQTGTAAASGTTLQTLSTKMIILNNGNIGIGTTVPKETLSVNGNLRAKQVKVETINWPDYVFDHHYELPSLLSLKAYIEKNQHLPEMPSAEDIKENGANLGELVKLQTKKIEELTLYAIDLKEENQKLINNQLQIKNEQEARIVALEKALEKLTKSK